MRVNQADSNILYTSTITGFLSTTFLAAEYKKKHKIPGTCNATNSIVRNKQLYYEQVETSIAKQNQIRIYAENRNSVKTMLIKTKCS